MLEIIFLKILKIRDKGIKLKYSIYKIDFLKLKLKFFSNKGAVVLYIKEDFKALKNYHYYTTI